MIVAQTIFDEDKGDGIVFDLTNFDVSSFEELDLKRQRRKIIT